MQLKHIFGRTEKEMKRTSQWYRTVQTALEMQIICIPVWTNVTAYIWEQSLLFLLIGRDFLFSEEETERKKTQPTKLGANWWKQLNELIGRCSGWLDGLQQSLAVGTGKFQAGIERLYYHWSGYAEYYVLFWYPPLLKAVKKHCKCILKCQNIQSHAIPPIKGKVRMGFDHSLMERGKDGAFSERYTSLSSAIGLQAASN